MKASIGMWVGRGREHTTDSGSKTNLNLQFV